MTDKALISELTWRSLKMQKEAFPDMPHYVAPDEIETMLRKSMRKNEVKIHVVAFGVIADNEEDIKAFAKLCRERKASVFSLDGKAWAWSQTPNSLVEIWRSSRKEGAAKIGARASADKKKANTLEAIEKIKDRWPLPSKEHPTRALLDEAGISLNTAKAHLGKRPIAQYNYQAKLKRAKNKEEKRWRKASIERKKTYD